jgi:succinyl-diaminopimelate desuccinylase
MDKNALAAVIKKIDGYRQEVIDIQTEMCKRPALDPTSGGEGEKEKAAYLRSYLEKLGLKVQQYDAPDKRVASGSRPNLVTEIPGRGKGARVMIVAHTDVVPPGDMSLWKSDPWKLKVDGDKLIGRGVEDNQGGLTAAMMAVKAFVEAGVQPERTVAVALVADEETASTYGLSYLLKQHSNVFRKDDLIIVPDSGNPQGTEIEVAEKSILWVKVRTIGKQTHGSVPETGVNAHKASAHLIVRMQTLYSKFRKRDPLFHPSNSTFEPTKKEANVPNINTIPGEDVVYFDCRILPDYKVDDVLKEIKKLARETEKKFKVKIELELVQKEIAAPPTPANAPVALAITRAMKDLRKRKPSVIGIGGGTVAKYLREAGFPCVVWSTMDEQAHRPNEYARIPHILADARVFAHVAMQEA